ncbi:V-type ATP synthase subunit E [Tissierella sp. MSJ-40]|uniref:V-type ATP synthase subunit E n=1 Tax=Tissierella simiarum TaxID=2841534 RepID=A0ABS6E8Z6_9FIRM|nr:V-type ATP synthase subunit E [Tissierella simiarum]MBU5439400.1 V-type ATP synthase subunit E [Tissierella simiarum]
MITLEDKLDIFYKIVLKDEEEKCKKTLEELEEKNNNIIKEKKEALEKRKKEIINRKFQLGEIQKNEMVSKARQDNREKVLSKRQETLEDLIFSLKEKGRQFTSSKEYKTYLINNIGKAMDNMQEKEIILEIREKDKDNFGEDILSLGKGKGINVILNIAKEDIIGGFIISDRNRTYNLDNSFKTIIEENKYLIGKTLYTSIEEAGDLYE